MWWSLTISGGHVVFLESGKTLTWLPVRKSTVACSRHRAPVTETSTCTEWPDDLHRVIPDERGHRKCATAGCWQERCTAPIHRTSRCPGSGRHPARTRNPECHLSTSASGIHLRIVRAGVGHLTHYPVQNTAVKHSLVIYHFHEENVFDIASGHIDWLLIHQIL